ncbi:hypothetical protein L6164_011020 [Bauhinia variegata]|uniref:Uncharacterized protein n=1 Tax=Bauhinia variegata TaxID=167791 RepID=A0ACB9P577_BAUVA|nr:hypothetical protein L6164_011020 [Bauhinia variegata]
MTMFIENEGDSSGERRVQFNGTADSFEQDEQMVDDLNLNLGLSSIGNLSDEIGDEGGSLARRGRKRIKRVLGVELLDAIREKLKSEEGNGVGGYYVNAGNEDDEDNSSVLDLDTGDPGSLFSCPICDFDVELPVLCSHLQEEHCFDLKIAVCPVCAANFGKNPVEHLTLQHPSLLKRRWKSDKPNIWYGNSAMLGKKLATDSRGNKHESVPDPLFSPFICNVSVPNPNSIHGEELSINNILIASDANCTGTNTQNVGNEQDHQERREKATFVQELVASTIS